MSDETILDTRTIFEGRVVNLDLCTVRLSNGRITTREVIRYRGAAGVVPIDDEGNVLLVRQFRLAVNRALLEIPAGGLDPAERPRDCAIREMQEETGYKPGELVELGYFLVAPGYSSERIDLFLGRSLEPAQLEMDDDESIALVRLPFDQVLEMVYDGQIEDSKTIIGVLAAAHYLKR
jgi:ADP-ribose pyrophosphatase